MERETRGEGSSSRQGVAAGLAGGVVFIAALFIFDLSWWIAALAAAGGFAAGFLIFTPRKRRVPRTPEEASTRSLEETLEDGRRMIEELEDYIRRISSPGVRSEAEGIRDAARSILEEIRRDPEDEKTARPFLSYHFVATLKVLRGYVDLTEKGASGPDAERSLTRVEDNLHLIREAFEKQYQKLLENDTLDLDVEISVLEKTLRMEGLGKGGGREES